MKKLIVKCDKCGDELAGGAGYWNLKHMEIPQQGFIKDDFKDASYGASDDKQLCVICLGKIGLQPDYPQLRQPTEIRPEVNPVHQGDSEPDWRV